MPSESGVKLHLVVNTEEGMVLWGARRGLLKEEDCVNGLYFLDKEGKAIVNA